MCDIIDTPGVNAVEGVLSEDELITRRILEAGEADLILQVADARNLRRALYLTSQLAAFRQPTVLVLNMADEARESGILIDTVALSAALGVPVVETVATDGQGLDELRESLPSATRLNLGSRLNGEHARWAHELAGRCREARGAGLARWQERLGRAVREPLTGLPILALVLYAVCRVVAPVRARPLPTPTVSASWQAAPGRSSHWGSRLFEPTALRYSRRGRAA